MKNNRYVLAVALCFGSAASCVSATVDGVTRSDGAAATLKIEECEHLTNRSAGFLIAGDGSTGLSSIDGLSWTPRVVNLLTNWRSLARGQGLVVAIDCAGQLQTSADGVNWISRSPGTRSALHRLAYGNGRYVAVGNEGALVTSDDGVTWTNQASGTDERLRGIAFGGGLFVVVGYAGTILTSRDGTRWTRQNSGTQVRLLDVAHGNGMFVAVGWHGFILTSTTGTKWTRRSSGTLCHLHHVQFGSIGIAPAKVPAIIERTNSVQRRPATGSVSPAVTRKPVGEGAHVACMAEGYFLREAQ